MPDESVLRNLHETGRLVKDQPYRQVWRFEFEGKAYYLKFYLADGFRDWFRRRFRGSPAMREFTRLQWLQKAGVPAPRAVAALMGFQLAGRRGDALILEGIEPSVQLDKHLNQLELSAQPLPGRLDIIRQIIELLGKMAKRRLGHSDLHLGNFILSDQKVYLLDAYAVHRAGLLLDDLLLLALSAGPYATRSEMQRVWDALGPGGPLPEINRRAPSIWHSLVVRAFKQDRYFGHIERRAEDGDWFGHYFKRSKFPHRWSAVSQLRFSDDDWRSAWAQIKPKIDDDHLQVLKRTRSGDVLEMTLQIAGRDVPVVIKRPRRKHLQRYLSDLLLGSRARRAWVKAWELVVRNVPTAWPMLLVQKRRLGYTTDAFIIMEKIDGVTLDAIDPGQDSAAYRSLLRRCGRLLRRLEQSGLFLYDAKAQNWMVRSDPQTGLTPVLIDTDSVRRIRQSPGGLPRLVRSLRENPRFPLLPENAIALVRGYRPAADRTALARLGGLTAGEVDSAFASGRVAEVPA